MIPRIVYALISRPRYRPEVISLQKHIVFFETRCRAQYADPRRLMDLFFIRAMYPRVSDERVTGIVRGNSEQLFQLENHPIGTCRD